MEISLWIEESGRLEAVYNNKVSGPPILTKLSSHITQIMLCVPKTDNISHDLSTLLLLPQLQYIFFFLFSFFLFPCIFQALWRCSLSPPICRLRSSLLLPLLVPVLSLPICTPETQAMSGVKVRRGVVDTQRLAGMLQRQATQTLVIDSRTFSEYNASHVLNSINVCCSKLVKRRLQQDKVSVAELLQPNGKIKVQL